MKHLAALLFLVLAGCASSGANLPPLPPPTETVVRLAPNDKLRIDVFGAPDMSGEVQITDGGAVSLPLIGPVKAAGLTPTEFTEAVQTKLADGYMRDPKVSVQVQTYRPIYIYGEVGRPGEFPFTPGMSVQQAVAVGGGFTYRAQQGYAVVTRNGQQYRGEPMAKLQPGDSVLVPERFF